MRWVSLIVAFALVAGACGSTSTETTNEGAATSDSPRAGGDGVTPLDFLGDLVVVGGDPAIDVIDAEGGTVTLADGSRVVAPPGAFAEATEMTTQVSDLDLGQFFDTPPFAKAFVVSTVEDIDLAAPVRIEIQRPSEGLRAVQRIDGEFVPAEVIERDGVSTVEIPHFSEVVTLVVEAFSEQRSIEVEREEQAAADAEFFQACFVAVSGIYGGSVFVDGDRDDEQAEFAQDLAMNICTTALVRRASPSGVLVSTDCVGDRISDDIDFRDAVALCADDAFSETSSDASEEQPADDSTGDDSPGDGAVVPTPVIDGLYTGVNDHIWVHSGFDVLNDEVTVEVANGAIVRALYERDWFRFIALSGTSPDWFDGAQCEYYAHVQWESAGPSSSEVVVDEAAGTSAIVLRQTGQLNHWIEFPDCPREYVPVQSQADGTDNVSPVVGQLVVQQQGDDVVVQFVDQDDFVRNESVLSPG